MFALIGGPSAGQVTSISAEHITEHGERYNRISFMVTGPAGKSLGFTAYAWSGLATEKLAVHLLARYCHAANMQRDEADGI